MALLRRSGVAVNWLGLGVIVAVLLLWQVLVWTGVVALHSLPGPVRIAGGFGDLIDEDRLFPAISHTVQAVAMAWGLAVAIGGIGGLILGVDKAVATWTTATVDVFRSLPVLAFIPIAILIWGPATKSEVLVGAYAAVWPMLMNTAGGVHSVAPRLHDVARSLRIGRAATLLKIVMPATGASMIVGARLALGIALIVCVVCEMIGTPLGIGSQLVLMQAADQPERMWAYVLTIGTLGICLNAILVMVTRLAFPGVSQLAERSRR